MTNDEKLMQQALDALETEHSALYGNFKTQKAIEALRARLAQPDHEAIEKAMLDVWQDVGDPKFPSIKPEPQEAIAKWIKTNTEHKEWYICPKCKHQTPRFKDKWQELTDEEIAEMHYEIKVRLMGVFKTEDIYRAIEAKLKEKNNA